MIEAGRIAGGPNLGTARPGVGGDPVAVWWRLGSRPVNIS